MTLPRWVAPGTDGRVRAALLGAVAIGAVVAAIVLSTRWILLEQHEREVDRSLRADVDELRELAADAGDGSDLGAVFDRWFTTHHPGPDGVHLGLVDGRPHVRSAAARYAVEDLDDVVRDWGGRRSSAFGVVDTPTGPLRYLVSPISADGRVVGTFVAGTFLDPGRDRVGEAVRTVAVLSGVFLALGALVAWLLARRGQESVPDGSEVGVAQGDDVDVPPASDPVEPEVARERAVPDDDRTQLLDGISRELVAVSSVVRLHLDDAGPGQPLSGGSMRLVRDELSRMGSVAEDLRLLAEAAEDGFLQVAPVDVAALTAEVGDRARSLGERTWEVRPAAPVVVPLDAERIRHAWLHLARNAVEHTWRSDRISVFAEVAGSVLELGVADAGRGIEPADVPALFEPFRRGPGTARSATAGGGLGLTVAKAVAEAHGGSVEVRPTGGGGATVVLRLPIDPG